MPYLEDLISYISGAKKDVMPKGSLRSMADSALINREPDYYNKLLGYEGIEVRPYNDHKGIPTIGIGHVIQKGEDFRNYKKEDFQKLFNEKDLPKYLNRTRNIIKDFDKFPAPVKEEMLASVFRGDLSGSPKTLKLINEGKYDLAAIEFLNNDEYRQAKDWEKKKNKRHGVAVRMENLSKELNNLNRRKQ